MSSGRRPARAASISPLSSRSSGSMNGRPRNAYASSSRGERAQLGGVAGQRLAVLADPQEALLGQAPATVARHRAEPDVVFLGPGEVDPVGPRLARRHDHQVGLRPAHQPDGGLVAALVDDRIDEPERRERLDQRLRLVGLGEDVEVADRLLPAPERAGRLHRADARASPTARRSATSMVSSARSRRIRSNRSSSLAIPSRTSASVLVDIPRRPLQTARLGGLAQVVDGLDAEVRVELPDGLRARARGCAAARPGSAGSPRGGGRSRPCGRSSPAPGACR